MFVCFHRVLHNKIVVEVIAREKLEKGPAVPREEWSQTTYSLCPYGKWSLYKAGETCDTDGNIKVRLILESGECPE